MLERPYTILFSLISSVLELGACMSRSEQRVTGPRARKTRDCKAFSAEAIYFRFSKASRLTVGSTQFPFKCSGGFCLAVNWSSCEADHLPQSSAEFENVSREVSLQF